MAYAKQHIPGGVTVGSLNFPGATLGQVLISDANGEMTPGTPSGGVPDPLDLPAGTASAPSLTFGSVTSGIYGVGANSIGAAVGGVASVISDAYRGLTVGPAAGAGLFNVVQGTAGVGTVAVSGTGVTGDGTKFTRDFKVGDTISVTTTSGSETKAIATITSDTDLVTAAFTGTAAAGTAYTLVGGTRFSIYGNGNVRIGLTSKTAERFVIRNTTLNETGRVPCFAVTDSNDVEVFAIRTAKASDFTMFIGSGGNSCTGDENTCIGINAGVIMTSCIGNTAVGASALPQCSTAGGCTAIGDTVLFANNAANSTAIGYRAGFSNNGGGIVALGYQAGYRSTAGNILIIDNQDRTTAAAEAYKSLIYGVFHATPESQYVCVNGELRAQLTGAATADTTLFTLTNRGNAASMIDTRASIRFDQFYYDGTTPAVADAAKITVGTEGNWNSTASTQDSYMSLSTCLNGVVSEAARINSNKNLLLNATATDATFSGGMVLGNVLADPSDHTDDQISIYAKDASTGGSTLAIWTECAYESIGTFSPTIKRKIWWNGYEFWIALDPVVP